MICTLWQIMLSVRPWDESHINLSVIRILMTLSSIFNNYLLKKEQLVYCKGPLCEASAANIDRLRKCAKWAGKGCFKHSRQITYHPCSVNLTLVTSHEEKSLICKVESVTYTKLVPLIHNIISKAAFRTIFLESCSFFYQYIYFASAALRLPQMPEHLVQTFQISVFSVNLFLLDFSFILCERHWMQTLSLELTML